MCLRTISDTLKTRINKRTPATPKIDPVRSAFEAHRWGAHVLFRLASLILRG
jgi:hypothetical protein